MNKKGFTLVEIIIVVAIMLVLIAVAVPNFLSIKKQTDVDNTAKEMAGILTLARNKALASENNSRYGVYFDAGVSPNQYILFVGDSYALSDPALRQAYFLPSSLEFYNMSVSEVIFDRITGASQTPGSVSVRIKTDTDYNKTVYITNSGVVGYTAPTGSLDASRIKDSRHIEFAYSRNIDTVNETITLTFDNSQTRIIQISSCLVAGQLQWKDTTSVDGSDQIIEISTKRLNSPDTLFSVFRDRRYNNKSLKITISGDSTGYLASYSADGTSTDYASNYVSNFGAL